MRLYDEDGIDGPFEKAMSCPVAKQVAFTLSMPNRASWNGRWSGEDKAYVLVRSLNGEQSARVLAKPSYYFGWSDGWGALVSVEEVDGKRAKELKRKSAGFNGYDWMVDSIVRHGKIRTD